MHAHAVVSWTDRPAAVLSTGLHHLAHAQAPTPRRPHTSRAPRHPLLASGCGCLHLLPRVAGTSVRPNHPPPSATRAASAKKQVTARVEHAAGRAARKHARAAGAAGAARASGWRRCRGHLLLWRRVVRPGVAAVLHLHRLAVVLAGWRRRAARVAGWGRRAIAWLRRTVRRLLRVALRRVPALLLLRVLPCSVGVLLWHVTALWRVHGLPLRVCVWCGRTQAGLMPHVATRR